ncbi:imidazole glycerol phosphate synthase subunit HisH, partial [Sulfuricurvum sp.]|uniref:imidazole glycerol phosphate synthase subunit HisH n=1 Tax=Sulfuricurvum sp. TaxID=2025608 RepID=UPI0019A89B5B
MIAMVDYHMGNLASVKNAFDLLGEHVIIESDPEKLKNYDRIILPGVGAFGDAMKHLKQQGMDEAIKEFAQSGKYLLGICLGMQLLFESSEEFGLTEGLGLIKGRVVAFDSSRFH